MRSDDRRSGNISAEGSASEDLPVAEGRKPRWKNFVTGCILVVLTIVLLVGAKVAVDVYERQSKRTSERIQVLEGEVREYSKLDVNLANLSGEILEVQERMAHLDEQLEKLIKKSTTLKDSDSNDRGWEAKYRRVASQLEVLRGEVRLLRDHGPENQFATGAALLTLAQLQANLSQGKPCVTQLEVMGSFFDDLLDVADYLNNLSMPCEQGVLTKNELERRFPAIARDVMRSSGVPDNATLLERVSGALASLVTVRPVGPQVLGRDPAALLARTEISLAAGNLSDALASIRELDITQGVGLGWINALEAHVLAMRAVDKITADLIITTMDGAAHNE